jgi:putative endonuclease
MKGYVYILKDTVGKFYVGSTNDVDRRLNQHISGHTQTTNRMTAPNLVLVQEYDSLVIARKIERKIKGLKRKDYIEKMVKEGYIRIVS